jgi:hypothetical protein
MMLLQLQSLQAHHQVLKEAECRQEWAEWAECRQEWAEWAECQIWAE